MPNMLNDAEKQAASAIITLALAEDTGGGDVTSVFLLPEGLQASMKLVAREPLISCGTALLQMVFDALDVNIEVSQLTNDGNKLHAGDCLAHIRGNARILLGGERVALNLLQRLCAVATLTAQYVDAIKGTHTHILDTRKTMPAYRLLDKYAVRAGGGYNHRMGLHDMVLIKDNHIALCGGITQVLQRANSAMQQSGSNVPMMIECDTLKQVEEALAAGVKRILLDNMNLDDLRGAVQINKGRAKLEASGGVTLKTVRDIALTGVDYISIGALTHSARAVDIGADIVFER